MNTSALSAFKTIWQSVIRYFMQGAELQVWQVKASDGHTFWRAFDPKSQRTTSLGSEAEMRMWIEESYYR